MILTAVWSPLYHKIPVARNESTEFEGVGVQEPVASLLRCSELEPDSVGSSSHVHDGCKVSFGRNALRLVFFCLSPSLSLIYC